MRSALSVITHELCQNAAGRLRMDERDLQAEHPPARLLVDQDHVEGLEPIELGGEILDLKGHVVPPRASLGEEPPDRRVRAERLEELDPGLADPQRRRLHPLILDVLAVLEGGAEEVGVDEDRGVEIVDGDSHVMEARCHRKLCHSCSRIAYTSSLCHSPFTHSFSTRCASRRMPSFSRTRAEAVLRGSSRPVTRWKPCAKAQPMSARAASVAYPWPWWRGSNENPISTVLCSTLP